MPVPHISFSPLTILLLSFAFLLCACQKQPDNNIYSLDDARYHMQNNNWDSAKIYAVNVLAWAEDEKEISLANTIISMANENLSTDRRELQEQRSSIFRNVRMSYEAEEDITWIYDPKTTQSTNRNSFHLYIGTKDNEYWVQFRVQYRGLRKLSMLGYTVKTDNNSYTFSPEGDIQSGQEGRIIWEWFDQKYAEKEHEMIEDILSSDSAELILIGSKGNFEREITADEKEALKNILEAYKVTPGFSGYFPSENLVIK